MDVGPPNGTSSSAEHDGPPPVRDPCAIQRNFSVTRGQRRLFFALLKIDFGSTAWTPKDQLIAFTRLRSAVRVRQRLPQISGREAQEGKGPNDTRTGTGGQPRNRSKGTRTGDRRRPTAPGKGDRRPVDRNECEPRNRVIRRAVYGAPNRLRPQQIIATPVRECTPIERPSPGLPRRTTPPRVLAPGPPLLRARRSARSHVATSAP